MNYLISAATDIGNTKNTNQDSYYAGILSAENTRMVFAVLCDGMGGLDKGEVASVSVVHAYMKWSVEQLPLLLSDGLSDEAISRDWCDIAACCNDHIRSYGKNHRINLGTTAVVILLAEQRYYIMNVGDSRAYEISDNCRVLTKDQTVVAQEVEMGILTPEQARTDPRRSVLLQCIGAMDNVCPDMYFGEMKRDAVYMLCSDGFRHEITVDEICSGLHPSRMQSIDAMRQNEQALIELNKKRRERDNISVVTIHAYG